MFGFGFSTVVKRDSKKYKDIQNSHQAAMEKTFKQLKKKTLSSLSYEPIKEYRSILIKKKTQNK